MTLATFHFIDPGPLRDGDLELVPLHARWVDYVLRAASHPLTRRDAPQDASVTRHQLMDMVRSWPNGHQAADAARGWVPAYHFWMKVTQPGHRTLFGGLTQRISIAGGIGLRIGSSDDIDCYYGHVGYHVYPASRGHHYAQRAVQLLLPLARHYGLDPLWITTNPDNLPSRRTCERLGADLVDTVDVPPGHPLYIRGEHQKCRYRLAL